MLAIRGKNYLTMIKWLIKLIKDKKIPLLWHLGKKCIAIVRYVQKEKEKRTIYSVSFKPPSRTYKCLIFPTGFGFSGTGTIVDFLAEFSNTTVIGDHDTYDCATNMKIKASMEFNFLRYAGGVFNLEYIIESNNMHIQDFAVKQFITLSEYLYSLGGFYTDEYMRLTNEFIEKLINVSIKTNQALVFNPAYKFSSTINKDYKNFLSPFVINHKKNQYIYFIKKISKDEYRKLAHEYIVNVLNTIESKHFLVLDQGISDGDTDLNKKIEYIGDLKQICVYRDPRDNYVTIMDRDIQWYSHVPEDFVKQFLAFTEILRAPDHRNRLILKFEDFVLKYDETAMQIMHFLGLDMKQHIAPKKMFDPSKSIKNIGLWKNYKNQEAIKYIEKELKEYCYYE